MRLIRFIARGCEYPGEDHLDGSATVLDPREPSLRALWADGEAPTARRDGPRPGDRVIVEQRLAPIRPRDVLCAGRNYRGPGEAAGRESLPELELFMKPSSAVQHPGGPILVPGGEIDEWRLDVEGELAVIIGVDARGVSEDRALDHVLGYTIANDVTARRWQRQDLPMAWMRGKGFDTFCPLGPAIVTADELTDASGLTNVTSVNGDVVRRGSTADMIRSLPRLISEISARLTLRAGGVLLTGAPPPLVSEGSPRSLRVGDRVAIEIDRLGRLENRIEAR